MVSYTPRPLYSRETIPSTHRVGNCVDQRVSLGVTKRNYSLTLSLIRNPDCPARSLVTIPAAFSQILPILRNKWRKKEIRKKDSTEVSSLRPVRSHVSVAQSRTLALTLGVYRVRACCRSLTCHVTVI